MDQIRPKNTTVELSTSIGSLQMQNPVTVASGTFSSGKEYFNFVDVSCLGAVTTKGVTLREQKGNPQVRIAEVVSGMLNTIGLQNPGVDCFIKNDIAWLNSAGAKIIVNVSGNSIDEYCDVIQKLNAVNVDAYEINISCPNIKSGGLIFGKSAESVSRVVGACRDVTTRTIIVKLSPNVTDIAEIARAAESSGADGLSLINTPLGMAIDVKTRKPVLSHVVGGLSGPAIKPIALRCVWECHNAVRIPIIGIGGIQDGLDAIEFILAGASAVGVGTANFMNPFATVDVINGITDYCENNNVKDIKELIGALDVKY